MGKELCLSCRAPLPSAASFCPACGHSNAPVLLGDVDLALVPAATVELGGGFRRWPMTLAVGGLLVLIVGSLWMGSDGNESLTAATTVPTSTSTSPATSPSTSTTRVRATTTTEPAVQNFAPFVADASAVGRRLAILGGGEIRELDLGTGVVMVVARGVTGESLVAIDGGYAVGRGDGVTIWVDGDKVADTRGGGGQLLGEANGAAIVLDWDTQQPTVSFVWSDRSLPGPTLPQGLWPVSTLDQGLIATTDGNGTYMVGWDGVIRRISAGRVVGVWSGGIQSVTCDETFTCSVESRSLDGVSVSAGPAADGCCWTPRRVLSDVAVLDRGGVTRIVPLGDGAPAPTDLDHTYLTTMAWPDEQWLVLSDGFDMKFWSRVDQRQFDFVRPAGMFEISAITPIP